MAILFLITLWIGISIANAVAGSKRQIGAAAAFKISFIPSLILTVITAILGEFSVASFLFLLVSPIMGLIIVAFWEK